MQTTITVSVIIPCYNAEKFIAHTIQSVLNQTFDNLEVILINDGSTDDSEKIILSFEDKRIKYIKKENSGVAATRNYGIDLAQGKYIAFLDADDLFLPDNLGNKVQYLEKKPEISLVHSAEIRFDSLTNTDKRIVHGLGGNVLHQLLEFSGNVIHSPSSVVVRKEKLKEVNGFDENLSTSADWDLWVRLANKSEFGYLDFCLVKYREHSNQMHYNISLMEKDMLYAFKKFKKYDFFKDKKYYRYCLAKICLILSACYRKDQPIFFKFIYFLIKSIFLHPKPFLQKIFKAK